MVDPLGVLPKKPSAEGFAPLPSYPANEFMAMQGAWMALNFGAYYSIGKRAIAKLDNEDFNLMLAKPQLFKDHLNVLGQPIIDNFQERVNKYTEENQKIILDKAYDLEKEKLEVNYKLMTHYLGFLAGKGAEGISMVMQLLGISEEEAKKFLGIYDYPEPQGGTSDGSTYDPSQPTDWDNVPDSTSPTPTPEPTPEPTPTPEYSDETWNINYSFGGDVFNVTVTRKEWEQLIQTYYVNAINFQQSNPKLSSTYLNAMYELNKMYNQHFGSYYVVKN